MERTVYALVENDQNQFAVIPDGNGGWTLPTCTVDVGGSFSHAVMLDQVDVRVLPEAFLAFDTARANMFYLCHVKGQPDSLLQLQWQNAAEVLALAPQPSFHSVEEFLQRDAARTREPLRESRIG